MPLPLVPSVTLSDASRHPSAEIAVTLVALVARLLLYAPRLNQLGGCGLGPGGVALAYRLARLESGPQCLCVLFCTHRPQTIPRTVPRTSGLGARASAVRLRVLGA